MPLALENPRHLWRLMFQGSWPTSVAFTANDRLVAGNRDGQLLLWDLTGEPLPPPEDAKPEDAKPADPAAMWPTRQLVGHANGITRLRALPDGRLLSASLDRSIRLWEPGAAATGTAELVLDIRDRRERAKRKRDEDALSAPGVEVETIATAHAFDAHADWVQGLDVDAGGTRMLSGDDGGTVVVHDVAARRELARWKGHPMTGVVSTALAPDGRTAFVAEYRAPRGDFDRPPAQARLYDVATGELRLDLMEVQFPDVKVRDNSYEYATKWGKWVGRGFVCSAFSPDGTLLAVGQGGETDTGRVHLVDPADGKVVRTVSGHQYGACDLLFSADGTHLVTVGRDTLVRIVRVSDGEQVAELGASRGGQFKDWLHAVALSPDERLLAAADIAGHVDVWQLTTE